MVPSSIQCPKYEDWNVINMFICNVIGQLIGKFDSQEWYPCIRKLKALVYNGHYI